MTAGPKVMVITTAFGNVEVSEGTLNRMTELNPNWHNLLRDNYFSTKTFDFCPESVVVAARLKNHPISDEAINRLVSTWQEIEANAQTLAQTCYTEGKILKAI